MLECSVRGSNWKFRAGCPGHIESLSTLIAPAQWLYGNLSLTFQSGVDLSNQKGLCILNNIFRGHSVRNFKIYHLSPCETDQKFNNLENLFFAISDHIWFFFSPKWFLVRGFLIWSKCKGVILLTPTFLLNYRCQISLWKGCSHLLLVMLSRVSNLLLANFRSLNRVLL